MGGRIEHPVSSIQHRMGWRDALHAAIEQQMAGMDQRIALGPRWKCLCPFCGLGDIKGVHHTKRETYVHYLPKALYPFNSINFRNYFRRGVKDSLSR